MRIKNICIVYCVLYIEYITGIRWANSACLSKAKGCGALLEDPNGFVHPSHSVHGQGARQWKRELVTDTWQCTSPEAGKAQGNTQGNRPQKCRDCRDLREVSGWRFCLGALGHFLSGLWVPGCFAELGSFCVCAFCRAIKEKI